MASISGVVQASNLFYGFFFLFYGCNLKSMKTLSLIFVQ